MRASDVAKFLGKELVGQDIEIKGVCSLDNTKPYCVTFCKRDHHVSFEDILIIRKKGSDVVCKSFIDSENPRLDFTEAINEFFCKEFNLLNHPYKGVTIYDSVEIGRGCHFKHGTVIGDSGFGFQRDENGVPIRRPHLGRVIIGNDVELGANNTIDRGTIDDTIIQNNVKTDNLVHIAHNCEIGENTMLAAGVTLSGGVIIGKNCFIGTGVIIKQRVKIGDNVLIGIGSVVTKDIPPNEVWAGNPARKFRDNKYFATGDV
jgi:UDP-3-O-[3-hydroxymyristoyl] glucosamine N-acyltransferase